jgi:hypothetical protein
MKDGFFRKGPFPSKALSVMIEPDQSGEVT